MVEFGHFRELDRIFEFIYGDFIHTEENDFKDILRKIDETEAENLDQFYAGKNLEKEVKSEGKVVDLSNFELMAPLAATVVKVKRTRNARVFLVSATLSQ